MLPVPSKEVNTLLPAFLQVLKAAGECLFRNVCELQRRSRLNSLDIRLPKSSSRIWWQVDLLICRASVNICTVTVRSSLSTVSDANHAVFVPWTRRPAWSCVILHRHPTQDVLPVPPRHKNELTQIPQASHKMPRYLHVEILNQSHNFTDKGCMCVHFFLYSNRIRFKTSNRFVTHKYVLSLEGFRENNNSHRSSTKITIVKALS